MQRHELLNQMVSQLSDISEVLACWEGGSTAFGANDALSDIDLQVMVRDGSVARTWQTVEERLRLSPGILERYEVPFPTWHGHWQAFYLFDGMSPFHMLDLVVMEEGAPWHFLEVERHGRGTVLIDRKNYCVPVPLEQLTHLERMTQRRSQLIVAFRIFHWLIDKELLRGRTVDAIHFYLAHVGRVVELARMKYCPERYDFGARYLSRDLPPEMFRRLELLYFVRDLEDLKAKKRELITLFHDLLDVESQPLHHTI